MLTGPTLLIEIERFLRSGVYSETYFGTLAVKDSKLVARLRAGGTVTLEKAEQIIAFITKAETEEDPRRSRVRRAPRQEATQ